MCGVPWRKVFPVCLVSAFVLLALVVPAGAVRLVAPNGGEVLFAGSTYHIQWVSQPGEYYFTLQSSINGGQTWFTFKRRYHPTWTGDPEEAGGFPLIIPAFAGNKRMCLVRIIAFNEAGARVGADRSDAYFIIKAARFSDLMQTPAAVAPGFVFQEPPPDPADEHPDRTGQTAAEHSEHHSGLEGTNYILVELGTHENAGSDVESIEFLVGNDFTINLHADFVPGASLRFDIPGSCAECYKTIPADGWDNLRLRTTSGNGLQIHRVAVVKSNETILDTTPDAWLDNHYGRIMDLSLNAANTKWDDSGNSRATAIYYATQDLGQTGGAKYVSSDVEWCSEFVSHFLRKVGLSTPTGSIGVNQLQTYFEDHDRYWTKSQVEAGDYNVKPGDYFSVHGENHSVLFRGWVGGSTPSNWASNPQFYTVEGNWGNSVRSMTRSWSEVDWVGCGQ